MKTILVDRKNEKIRDRNNTIEFNKRYWKLSLRIKLSTFLFYFLSTEKAHVIYRRKAFDRSLFLFCKMFIANT